MKFNPEVHLCGIDYHILSAIYRIYQDFNGSRTRGEQLRLLRQLKHLFQAFGQEVTMPEVIQWERDRKAYEDELHNRGPNPRDIPKHFFSVDG